MRLAGVAVRLKVAAALTTSVTDAWRTVLPLVPRMVSVEVPAGVFAAVWTRRALVMPPAVGVIAAGVRVVVALAGRPVRLRLTRLVNWFTAVSVTV